MFRLPFPRMPSGKRARQQRQAAAVTAPPPVRSKGIGGARTRQASPRALAIAGGVVLLAIVAIVLGVVLSKGGGSGGSNTVSKQDTAGLPAVGSQTWPGALQGAGEANDLFKGIPQKGLVLGSPKAPIEMEMFIDVQCPVCQNYEAVYLPTVVRQYIRTGKVQLHLQPWAFIGPQSSTGRYGVIAAGAQNKAFEYTKLLYDNQPPGSENSGWLDGKMMANIAASVSGLNLERWRKDTNSAEAQSVAGAVDKLASKSKVSGTPTILVGCKGKSLHDIVAPTAAPNLQDTTLALNALNCSK